MTCRPCAGLGSDHHRPDATILLAQTPTRSVRTGSTHSSKRDRGTFTTGPVRTPLSAEPLSTPPEGDSFGPLHVYALGLLPLCFLFPIPFEKLSEKYGEQKEERVYYERPTRFMLIPMCQKAVSYERYEKSWSFEKPL